VGDGAASVSAKHLQKRAISACIQYLGGVFGQRGQQASQPSVERHVAVGLEDG